ncbi:MAG: arsenate reductase (glutaredoxin) [Crocinitomicaceae bacterium]
MIKIWHNNRCSKSRQTLAILKDKTKEVEVVEYLTETPSEKEIREVLEKLSVSAESIIRKGEKEYKEHFKGKEMSEDMWIHAMLEYPKLIERPIVIKGDKAVIGRPPEKVLELL